jgi:hypothetical protein
VQAPIVYRASSLAHIADSQRCLNPNVFRSLALFETGGRLGANRGATRRQRSRSGGIEEVGLTFDVERFNSAEPGCTEQRFGTFGSHAGAEPGTASGQRLRHAVEQAETIIHRRDRTDIVLDPIRRPRLDNEQSAIGLHEMTQLPQRLARRREIVNAIARGDEVKAFAFFQLTRRIGDELDAVTKASSRRCGAGLSDRFRVGIETHNLALGKRLRDCRPDAPDAAAEIENTASVLQPSDNIWKFGEPIAAEAIVVARC